uniref:Uncharacterized protein n=1 Tax=Oryza meridionalis TaxID=40149 RepID=A0A0E0EZ28_9ORYZ
MTILELHGALCVTCSIGQGHRRNQHMDGELARRVLVRVDPMDGRILLNAGMSLGYCDATPRRRRSRRSTVLAFQVMMPSGTGCVQLSAKKAWSA